jgi:hypothetical protein
VLLCIKKHIGHGRKMNNFQMELVQDAKNKADLGMFFRSCRKLLGAGPVLHIDFFSLTNSAVEDIF